MVGLIYPRSHLRPLLAVKRDVTGSVWDYLAMPRWSLGIASVLPRHSPGIARTGKVAYRPYYRLYGNSDTASIPW